MDPSNHNPEIKFLIEQKIRQYIKTGIFTREFRV